MRDFSGMSERRLMNLLRRTADPAVQAAVSKIFREHLTRYVEICVRQKYPKLVDELENIIDEVFGKLWEKEGSFQSNSVAYRKMIRQTIFWHCSDLIKNYYVEDYLDSMVGHDDEGGLADEWIDAAKFDTSINRTFAEQPEDWMRNLLIGDTTREVLDEMKADAREMLMLYYVMGKDQSEIAEIMGKKRGTIRAGLSRARHNFKEQYLRKLAQGRNQTEEETIINAIASLPQEKRAVVQAWWEGARTKDELNKKTNQNLSQSAIGLLLAQGLILLCELLLELF